MDVFFLNKCQIHVHFISCMESMHTFESISDYFAEHHFSPTFFFALRPIYSWRENNPQRPLLWSHVPVAHELHIRPSDCQRFLVVSRLHDIYQYFEVCFSYAVKFYVQQMNVLNSWSTAATEEIGNLKQNVIPKI